MKPVTMDEFTKEFTKEFTAILKDFMKYSEIEKGDRKCEFLLRTRHGEMKLHEIGDFLLEAIIEKTVQRALLKTVKDSDISKEALN